MAHAPSDAVILELGRIVWEAITLEDHVYQVAGHLYLDPEDEPVGTCITKATKKLRARGDHPDLVEAIAWFGEARAALEDRNSVMHGLPKMSFDQTPNGVLAPAGPHAVEYLGRKRKTVVRVIPLVADELQKISSRLANVNARWQHVTIGVARFREVPWGPTPREPRLGRPDEGQATRVHTSIASPGPIATSDRS